MGHLKTNPSKSSLLKKSFFWLTLGGFLEIPNRKSKAPAIDGGFTFSYAQDLIEKLYQF